MNALGAELNLVGQRSVVAGLPWSFRFTRKVGVARVPLDLTGSSARWVVFDSVNPDRLPLEINAVLGGQAGTVALALTALQTTPLAAFERPRHELYFTDSLGIERLFMRGVLGVVARR